MNGKNDVWASVEDFRTRYEPQLNTLPVDVLSVIEIDLGLNIIPFPGLFSNYSVDAAVLHDFSGIYVDQQSYDYLNGQPIWQFNRLRFSLAHELGHIVMHRALVSDHSFKEEQDLLEWQKKTKALRGLEWEANEFAGRLLVPIDRLRSDFDLFVTQIQSARPQWWTDADLRNYLAVSLSQKYGVHKEVILCRFDREEIWPM
jgi:Zn-dependent peptidase ImmA (M78 family)